MSPRILPLLAALLLATTTACRTTIHHAPLRAVWVTRFDYKTAPDIEQVIANCAALGFNTVMFQVRGNGTAFYRSSFEPWADELGGADPGFDPLATAVGAAHAHHLSVHAWVNVMPSWRGSKPPANPSQLYLAHPEWHWLDQHGERQPLVDNFYVSLNPCLPAVRRYLVDVCREIVADYEVDGLHLDYVRFVDDVTDKALDYPRDAETLRLYREQTALAPDDDAVRWQRWKADQVTTLVGDLARMVTDEGADLWLSAAVGGAPEGPDERHQRDSRRWAEERLVDAVFPMNYTTDLALFRKRTAAWHPYVERVHVTTGLNFDLARSADLVEQELRDALAASPDLAVFAYSHLFATGTENDADARTRAIRRELVRDYLASPRPDA